MFRIGQKVVCIDDSDVPGYRWKDGDKPTVGKIYEVIGLDYCELGPCIFTDVFPHWAFLAWRFRPIVERKTDISIFTEMLTPTPGRVREMSEG